MDKTQNSLELGKRGEVIILRVSSHEKQRIGELAKKSGVSMSAYLRRAGLMQLSVKTMVKN